MTNPRHYQSSTRSMIVAVALASLIGCAQGGDPDAVSGSSTPPAIVSSTTAGYGRDAVSEPGTNWGMFDPYHTHCTRGCRADGGL
jgi:hypothetical protein